MKLVLLLFVALLLPTDAQGWSSAHAQISRCVFDLMPPALQALWRVDATFPPLPHIEHSIEDFITGMDGKLINYAIFSEAGDVVDGPCNACSLCDCRGAAPRVAAKLFLRDYMYGENSSGLFSKPWPYAMPVCAPPNVTTGCIPPPAEINTWTYHYFDFTPAENQRRAGAGAAWALQKAVAALRAGHELARPGGPRLGRLLPRHETFSTAIQPPYSSTKG